jgi:UDP-glucose 4-epimerase
MNNPDPRSPVPGPVLVTGGCGYIGSHVVRALLDRGDPVVVVDNLSTGHPWAVPEQVLVRGDLGDRSFLSDVFAAHRIAAVLHFASFIQVGESVHQPLKYYDNNLARTIALLDAMQGAGVNRFIFSSTAAVYGTPDTVPIREDAPLRPGNPYGRSKLMVEDILRDCGEAWRLETVALRYFNASGAHPSGEIGEAHDPESHLIPLVLQAASGRRESVTINGVDYDTTDGTCIRDYIHVCDLADAHLLALDRLLGGGGSQVYNLGNGAGYSVREVIDTCSRVTGRPVQVATGARRAGDPAVLVASSERIAADLGWRPRFSDLESIVADAWRWEQKLERGTRIKEQG